MSHLSYFYFHWEFPNWICDIPWPQQSPGSPPGLLAADAGHVGDDGGRPRVLLRPPGPGHRGGVHHGGRAQRLPARGDQRDQGGPGPVPVPGNTRLWLVNWSILVSHWSMFTGQHRRGQESHTGARGYRQVFTFPFSSKIISNSCRASQACCQTRIYRGRGKSWETRQQRYRRHVRR